MGKGSNQLYGGVTRVASGLAGHNQICWVVKEYPNGDLVYYPKHCTELLEEEKKRAYAFEILAIRFIKKVQKQRAEQKAGARLNETALTNTGIAGKDKNALKSKKQTTEG